MRDLEPAISELTQEVEWSPKHDAPQFVASEPFPNATASFGSATPYKQLTSNTRFDAPGLSFERGKCLLPCDNEPQYFIQGFKSVAERVKQLQFGQPFAGSVAALSWQSLLSKRRTTKVTATQLVSVPAAQTKISKELRMRVLTILRSSYRWARWPRQ